LYLQLLGFEKHENFMQLSWNYMNDALRSDVFMRYSPETVACACIYLSARYLNISLPKQPAWFSLFKVTEPEIVDICQRILRLYKRPKPNADDLDKKVDELKKRYQDAKLKSKGIVSGNNTPNSLHSPKNNNVEKPRSRSESRSRSSSRSPKHTKRGRSRTPDRKMKKHRSRRSYTPSPSPPRSHSKHSRDKRYRSRSRSPSGRSESYEKYYSSSDKKTRTKHRDSYEDTRTRSRH